MTTGKNTESNRPEARPGAPAPRAPEALNWRELTAVKALTGVVAHNQNVDEAKIRAFVEAAYAVTDIAGLRRDQFERVIAFLVDLNGELLAN